MLRREREDGKKREDTKDPTKTTLSLRPISPFDLLPANHAHWQEFRHPQLLGPSLFSVFSPSRRGSLIRGFALTSGFFSLLGSFLLGFPFLASGFGRFTRLGRRLGRFFLFFSSRRCRLGEHDHRQGSSVPQATTEFNNASESARPISKTWTDLRKQFLHHPFMGENSQGLPPRMEVSGFCHDDDPVRESSHLLCLCQGRLDLSMIQQGGHHVSQHHMAMAGGPIQFSSAFSVSHFLLAVDLR